MARKSEKLFRFFIYILPGVLFFSYQPLIHFGASESMNFEISLPLIWLVLFDILSFIMMARRRILIKGLKNKWLWLLFPIFLTISIFWSLNALRGLLTVIILWLIYFAVYSFWSLKSLFKEYGFKANFWKVFFGSTLVICAWCWLQCILDLIGVPQNYSLMCDGCTYHMFGFPHPDGFAIEPQFMGNLLLAPAIISGWMLLNTKTEVFEEYKRSAAGARSAPRVTLEKTSVLVFFILTATLFLTFSRGAIYAFLVAMVVMTIWELARTHKLKAMLTWPIIILAFLFTLNTQGIMAQTSRTNDTYLTGVSKVLNHLSLGIINITINDSSNASATDGQTAVFDGYVAESTDTRLRLTGSAVQIWHQSIVTALFGVGLGGAGQALYINNLSPAPKEIVQNQYASLLLETGLVGIVLFILTIVLIVRAIWRSSWRLPLLTLLLAYAISLLFFSGLPNALHIYLLPALLYALSTIKPAAKPAKSSKALHQ